MPLCLRVLESGEKALRRSKFERFYWIGLNDWIVDYAVWISVALVEKQMKQLLDISSFRDFRLAYVLWRGDI
jgi:hypothetical protein